MSGTRLTILATVVAFGTRMLGPPAWAAGPDGDVWIVRRCWTAWLPRYRARVRPAPRDPWAADTPCRRRAAFGTWFSILRLSRFLLLSVVFLGEWGLCFLLSPPSLAVRVLAHRAWPVYAERLGRSRRVWKARLPDARSAAQAVVYALDDVRNVGEPDRLWQYVRHL